MKKIHLQNAPLEANASAFSTSANSDPYANTTFTSNDADSVETMALGEGWAYHMGHYLADKKYGVNSSTSHDQGIYYYNNSPVNLLSSHLNLLENFSPYRTSDPFHWIPAGLFYDMMDNRNDLTAIPSFVNIDDQVLGYTNRQFFNAFSPGISTLTSYKTNLLQQNGNSQSVQINSLFSQYGY